MDKQKIISASNDTIFKLKILAEEKESVRRKLVVTAEKLRLKAKQLANTAEEKESIRRKLVVTAKMLRLKAKQLAVTAKEKENVRRKLVVTAEKLKKSRETLENKVLERTKSLEMAMAKEKAVLLSIGAGLIATDEKGKIIIVNNTAEKLFEKESKDILGKNFNETIFLVNQKGAFISRDNDPVYIALRTNTTVTTNDMDPFYYTKKDNTVFPLSIMVTPVMLNKKVIGTIKVFRDITNERQIDKAKTEFVSLASHQLRTPLSTVNWYAEMLLAGDVGELNNKQQKYLEEVYHSNQRMVELVNALLDVSRLELGTFTMDPKPTDISELTQNVIDEQKPQINEKGINFLFSSEKIPLINADPKLLRMVVQNILSNAVKYTPKNGKIKMFISLENKENVLLKISDTGYGIPKNQHSKIFTKLFRADNVRDKDTDGTGLGLYIVKSIVENSGGEIWFESPRENHGTKFFVSFPIKGMIKKLS